MSFLLNCAVTLTPLPSTVASPLNWYVNSTPNSVSATSTSTSTGSEHFWTVMELLIERLLVQDMTLQLAEVAHEMVVSVFVIFGQIAESEGAE